MLYTGRQTFEECQLTAVRVNVYSRTPQQHMTLETIDKQVIYCCDGVFFVSVDILVSSQTGHKWKLNNDAGEIGQNLRHHIIAAFTRKRTSGYFCWFIYSIQCHKQHSQMKYQTNTKVFEGVIDDKSKGKSLTDSVMSLIIISFTPYLLLCHFPYAAHVYDIYLPSTTRALFSSVVIVTSINNWAPSQAAS